MAACIGDDQSALELTGLGGIDPEVGGQLHRTAYARRHIDERSIREDGRIQRGVKVVCVGYDAAEVALDQLRMLLHRLREGAEDHAGRGETILKRGCHRNTVKDGIDGDAGEPRSFV